MEHYKLINKHNKGQALIELLLVIGLMAILIPALAASFLLTSDNKPQENNYLKASALLQEAEEALRIIKSNSWSAIETNGTFHPTVTGTTWGLAASEETIDNFTRLIEIEDVSRDNNGTIVTSGGIVDPSTKLVTTTVTWTTPKATTISNAMYLTRYYGNNSYTLTSQAEFDTGTYDQTESNTDEDTSKGTWQDMQLLSSYNAVGTANGLSVYTSGNYTYLVRADINADPDLVIIDVTDPSNPSELGGIDIGANVNDIYVRGDYAYLATATNGEELTIIDVSDKQNPVKVSALALGSSNDARTIIVEGQYAYIASNASGTQPEFFIVDITNPQLPYQVGSLEISATVYDLHVQDNYAYLATSHNTQELVIIDISNKQSPEQVGTFDSSATVDAFAVTASDSYAYLGTLNDSTGSEFFVIDVTDSENPVQVGTYEVGSTVREIFVKDNLAYLTTDNSANQVLVLDITSPTTPSYFSGLVLGQTVQKAYLDGDYFFIAGTSNTAELVIVKGGFSYLSPGNVVLTSIISPNSWDSPDLVSTANNTGNGVGLKTTIDSDYAFLGTSNDGTSPDLTIVDISNPLSTTVSGAVHLSANINDVAVSGNYAYLATSHNTQEFMVINITNKTSPSLTTSLNLGNNNDALSIEIQNNYAYVTKVVAGSTNREVYVIDISTPTSPSQVGTVELGNTGYDIAISGNYAYVGTPITNGEIRIIDISNPLSPTQVSPYNISGGTQFVSLSVQNNRLYVWVMQSGIPKLVVLDITNPLSVSELGSFTDSAYNVGQLTVVGSLAFTATDLNTTELRIFNISDPSNISLYGTLDLSNAANGIIVDGDYAYIATDDTSAELQVVEGGFSGTANSGTYTSATFDAGASVAFNNIKMYLTEPISTDIKFQIATNSDNSTWNYLGPDGTNQTYYENSSPVSYTNMHGRYLRIQALLEGDGISTPALEEVSINYSE